MKKGIILSSLLLFILASTAGKDFLFHFSDSDTGCIISESGDSPVSSDKSRFLACEDSEEQESRCRALPVLLLLDKTISSEPVASPVRIAERSLHVPEFFLITPGLLRAPPVSFIAA